MDAERLYAWGFGLLITAAVAVVMVGFLQQCGPKCPEGLYPSGGQCAPFKHTEAG